MRSLPVDLVKIDRRFIAGAPEHGRDRDILRGLVELCHAIGVEVVQEGIERPEELTVARALGIWRAQGFLLRRPRPAAAWLADVSARPERPAGATLHLVGDGGAPCSAQKK